jgi:hypothetical protein
MNQEETYAGQHAVKTAGKVFISYRRDDTGGDAGRLSDTLNQLLGPDRTFLDLDQIALGKDFEFELKRALSLSSVLLALIGPKWETLTGPTGKPRITDKRDLVRIELVTALKDKNVTVVPVLINRDSLPSEADLPLVLRPIRKLQAFQIRRDRWMNDVEALLKRLGFSQQPNPKSIVEDPMAQQARMVSANVEWKRKNEPDPNPRRWVVYVDNDSDAPITVEHVAVISPSLDLGIEDWGTVRPKQTSDYELDESEFEPLADRPDVRVLFRDSYGQRWSLRRGLLKRLQRSR